MIEPVSRERWQEAQAAELLAITYDDPEKSRRAVVNVFDYLGMSFDQQGKTIAEIGCAAYPAVRFCENIAGELFEPLWFPQLKDLTLNPKIHWWRTALEDVDDLPAVDECWLFNCLQHVRDPEEVVLRCKRMAPVIRFFEPVDCSICTFHPHTFSQHDFERWFGDSVKRYTDRLEAFFDGDCVYGTWRCA